MERKYRYALRNQDKIKNAFGEEYFTQHIKASLDEFFLKPFCLYDIMKMSEQYHTGNWQVIAINDVADKDDMQLFAVLQNPYDVVRLAYIERIKG